MVSKEEMLGLIKHLEKPLRFYEDPVYSVEEKEDIKTFEELVIEFYTELKKDGYIIMMIPEKEMEEDKRIVRFTKTTIDISNKLVKTREFNAEEGWFILLSLYCWWCEMIKNLLLDISMKIYTTLKGKGFPGFMTMYPFVNTMNEYKNGKFSSLFSDIDVDLRNSFVHGKINFPNNEIEYYGYNGVKRVLKLEDFISKYEKLAPLYATFFAYRLKIFAEEMKEIAKKKGFLD